MVPVFGVFLAQKINSKPFTVVGDGEQTRDFTYVTDVANALLMAMESNFSGEIFNVGSGKTVSINYLTELLNGSKIFIPKRPGEPDVIFADIEKIKNKLNWEPTISIEAGVEEILNNIDYWKNAPVWTPEKIQEATKEWFQQLGNKVEKISVLLLSLGWDAGYFLLLCQLKVFNANWRNPLLEYWLSMLYDIGIRDVYVNLHHHSQHVESFLKREIFSEWVNPIYEDKLLGTAGTLLKIKDLFKFDTILLIHADNWSVFSLNDFLNYHFYENQKLLYYNDDLCN